MAKKLKRILVYRLGSLGDMIVALPALHLVRRLHPDADIRMLTNFPVSGKAAAAEAVLAGSGLIDGYFGYPVGARQPLVLAALWWKLLRWQADAVVYLAAARGVDNARRDSRFFQICGIFKQFGVPLSSDLQNSRWQSETQALEPECERLARTLAGLGDAAVDDRRSWDLQLSPAEHARAAEAMAQAEGRPVIAFSIGTKVSAKDWGVEKWHALLGRMGELYPGHALIFTGVSDESEASEQAAQGWRQSAGPQSPVINLCGLLTPRETAACFARARVFLGHDSGPMHLAASVQTPVIAVFSSRVAPRVWFPYGRQHRVFYHVVDCMGCALDVCTIQRKKCINSISVEEVLAGVRAELG